MKDLVPAKIDVLVLLSRNFVRIGVVDIIEFSAFVPVHLDIFRQQRIQSQHRVLAIPDDLCVSVAPEEQMGHQGLPENKGRHFRVRLSVQDLVQRMIPCLFLVAVLVRYPIQVQRQGSNGFCQQSDTGIHSRDLHGRLFIHLFPCIGSAKHKGLPGITDIVRNLGHTFFR